MATIRLPGLVDPHVHLREPGQTHKEDWDSGTAAALAGGFVQVLAMPNTQPPLVDAASWQMSDDAAQVKARCDYGIFVGATVDNVATAAALAPRAAGLKMYLNNTFGTLRLDNLDSLVAHMGAWPVDAPLAVHAEERTAAAAILAAKLSGRSVHICHVSRKAEIELIARAKDAGLPVTCEVCPHHLFLTLADAPRIGRGRAEVRPMLATPADRDALWAHMADIDCFATDHAPHLLSEKDGAVPEMFGGDPAVPGFAGLETALALWLQAVHDGRLTLDDLTEKMAVAPRQIYDLPDPDDTWIDVDVDAMWTVTGAAQYTRCGWTPFEGWQLRGRVSNVVLRGNVAFADGQVLAVPGSGQNVRA